MRAWGTRGASAVFNPGYLFLLQWRWRGRTVVVVIMQLKKSPSLGVSDRKLHPSLKNHPLLCSKNAVGGV